MDKMAFYNSAPIFVQNLACAYEGRRLSRIRFGGTFQSRLLGYLDNEVLSVDEVAEIRNRKLRNIVRFSYEHCPFYTRLFNDCGLDPLNVRDERDLCILPILDKQTVKENINVIKPSDMKLAGSFVSEHTSGSTGASLVFPQSVENIRDLWAVFWRFWSDLGIDYGTTYADFGSRAIVPSSQSRPPFWRYSPAIFQVKFSAFHANDDNYMAYFEEIQRRKLTWIHGYPTAIVPFASFVIERGLTFDHEIRWVTTSAENLYDYQRSLIERAFGVAPYSLYSLTEATVCMHETPDHEMVIDEDYSLVELIPDGHLDGFCRIVGSNLTNLAFPLFRYDSGDLAVYEGRIVGGRRAVECIDGRNGELVRLPDGGTVGALAALFTESASIKEAQIVQKADYSVVIRYVPLNENYSYDLKIAESRFKERTRHLLPLSFERLEKIPRTKRGKLRYVISELGESSSGCRAGDTNGRG